MNWTLPEAARALDMPERELARLAREGALPSCRVDGRYLFNSIELREWATQENRKMPPVSAGANEETSKSPSLAEAIERGGVHYDFPGATPQEVFDAVAALPNLPSHVDRTLLAEVLRTREALASTGIGRGIAIPHARDPVVLHIERPIIPLCFLARAIDFKAVDRQAVSVLFVLLSPTIPLHLRLLSQLAFALHDDALTELLIERADQDDILSRVRLLEAARDASKGTGT